MADLLGWASCIFFAVCGVFQAWKSYKDGHSLGVSMSFILAWLIGEFCYMGGVMLKFGWVGWIMWNAIVCTVAIFVILRYKIWPRVIYFRGVPLYYNESLG